MKLIFKAKVKLESGNQKIQYGRQAAILKMTSLKINRLLPMATINMYMKFEIDIPKQTWLMLRKPCRLQTDGRTDRRTDGQTDKVNPVYPPSNFVGRGYKYGITYGVTRPQWVNVCGMMVWFFLHLFTNLTAWWRHQMETFSALLALCAGNSPVRVNSPHKGQWRGALMFTLICVWINGCVNNREAGDLRRYCAHYGVTVMELLNHY